MNSLGQLTVQLGLDAAEYVSGLSKAEYQAKKSMEQIDRASGIAASALTKLATVAATVGLAAGAMAVKFINAAADLDDLAEKTGGTVEELSKLEQQARISGTEMGVIEGALVRLARSLNGTDEESKKATRALEALGLKAEDLRNLDTASAFKAVSVALNEFADGGGKTALALDLMGKSAAGVLPYMKDLANDAELVANVTAKQAAEAEELGKEWRRVLNDVRNIGMALAVDLIPFIRDTISAFKDTKIETGALTTSFNPLKESLRALAVLGANVAYTFTTIGIAAAGVEAQLAGFRSGGFKGFSEAREIVKKILADEKAAFDERERRLMSAGSGVDIGGTAQEKKILDYAAIDPDREKKAVDAAKKRAAELKRIDQERMRDAERVAKLMADAEEQFEKDASDAFKFVADMQQKLNDRTYFENIYGEDKLLGMSIDDIRKFHAAVLDGAEAIATAGDAAMLAYAGFDENGRSLLEKTEKGIDAAKELGFTFSSAFEDAIVGGKKFRDVLDGIAQDIARIIIRKQVTEPLANAIGNFDFGGLFRGAFSGTQSPAPVSEAIPSYALGTDYVPRDTLAFLHKGESVNPPGRRSGEVIFHQTNYIDSRTDSAQVGQYMAVAQQRAVAAMEDQSRRRVR